MKNLFPGIVFGGNEEILEQGREMLLKITKNNRDDISTWLRLAEIEFMLGNRDQAVEYITRAGQMGRGMSPLLQEGRYESELIKGYLARKDEKWDEAVLHFRLGLSWGDERVLEKDQEAYLNSLAHSLVGNRTSKGPPVEAIYKAAKYLLEAGFLDESQSIVEILLGEYGEDEYWSPRIHELAGMIHEEKGDIPKALESYRQALSGNEILRIATLRMMNLHQDPTTTMLGERLLEIGPSYKLGAHGDGYQVDQPITLKNGWTLVGYDLDEDLLEQAHFLDIWLWWKFRGYPPSEKNWFKVGEYWIQRQRIVNLFPNAGFEWGVDERGLPLGLGEEIYGVTGNRFVIQPKSRNHTQNSVFEVINDSKNPDIGIASRYIPIDSDAYYLMSGWIWDQGYNGNLGRNCIPEDPDHLRQYYLADGYQNRPIETWIHFVGLGYAYIPEKTVECRSLLSNNNSSLKVRWDDVLWARIDLDPTGGETD